ncbi:MAG TPA: CDGSH iron-sulfur domain-containing protein [Candidatus Nanoarchaeia archaeon]|nr:CDGSH iron-sulfur domain-containing protein [Candidatus Nanoarchaeia archaeon]
MARIVVKEGNSPIEIKVGGESRWICMCGLSKNIPYCDGSHKKVADEQEGKVYKYLDDGSRVEVKQ